MERQKWFIDRIGKRVYRNSNDCKCEVCKNNTENGLIITDSLHAVYLYDAECMYNGKVKYFDTIEEAKEFVK